MDYEWIHMKFWHSENSVRLVGRDVGNATFNIRRFFDIQHLTHMKIFVAISHYFLRDKTKSIRNAFII